MIPTRAMRKKKDISHAQISPIFLLAYVFGRPDLNISVWLRFFEILLNLNEQLLFRQNETSGSVVSRCSGSVSASKRFVFYLTQVQFYAGLL